MTREPIPMCLVLLLDQSQQRILLGRKLRGFGRGKVIAPGGKLEPGESAVEAASRELAEETGLSTPPADVADVGELTFTWADPARDPFHVALCAASTWTGQLRATAELDPFWCSFEQVPYAQMWDDDRIWLPSILRGNRVVATIGYDLAGDHVETVDLQTLARRH